MPSSVPLPTLLSQALLAFIIEFDNEAERRIPHWTTKDGHRSGVWLVSMVMWSTCMRFVDEEGMTIGELKQLARTDTNLDGMRRWGYVYLEPGQSGGRSKPGPTWRIRATSKGALARKVWDPLSEEVEERWCQRFGRREVERLKASLQFLLDGTVVELPDCPPILGPGLFSRFDKVESNEDWNAGEDLSLPTLLSRVLLGYAIVFERDSDLSLAVCANVLRVLGEEPIPIKEMPDLTGVSKEAISMAMGVLQRGRYALEEPLATGRGKAVRLTEKGREAQKRYRDRLKRVEERSVARFGEEAISAIRRSLEPMVGDGTAKGSPLFKGLEPHPGNWRAKVPRPNTLPHYPMVLHRGGYPDGS